MGVELIGRGGHVEVGEGEGLRTMLRSMTSFNVSMKGGVRDHLIDEDPKSPTINGVVVGPASETISSAMYSWVPKRTTIGHRPAQPRTTRLLGKGSGSCTTKRVG
ncbi:hypothetical protein NL676_039852 [Syzygium grande]|nr:hypothetical protein NL676_039852 [Syzygium grande]